MDRRPSTQDITWLLDLNRNGQLDLDPPYQRRSVWTAKDRRFFLDTIFRNYPSPAIFLHKNISEDGTVKYHVVDGKQRLETILSFVSNKIRVGTDFGDERLDGKRWKDLTEIEWKHQFWNYQITVEMIDARQGELVRNVFDRLNRNSRRLTAQELRHARFEGWLITAAETEAEAMEWSTFGIATKARSNRMMDVQFISELMAVILRGKPSGFSQEGLDELYGEYEDLEELENFAPEDFELAFSDAKSLLSAMIDADPTITTWSKGAGHLYSLWCVLALNRDTLPSTTDLAGRYVAFMTKVDELSDDGRFEELASTAGYELPVRYRENARGASTEPAQRQARYETLREALTRQ